MFELRQFDLQLAFVGACALGKDIENQPGTVQHARLDPRLQIALLARTEVVIDDDNLGPLGLHALGNLFSLSGADKVARIGCLPTPTDLTDDFSAGRDDELNELAMRFVEIPVVEVQVDEQRPLPELRAFKHGCLPPDASARPVAARACSDTPRRQTSIPGAAAYSSSPVL